jgi:hypothetical protein
MVPGLCPGGAERVLWQLPWEQEKDSKATVSWGCRPHRVLERPKGAGTRSLFPARATFFKPQAWALGASPSSPPPHTTLPPHQVNSSPISARACAAAHLSSSSPSSSFISLVLPGADRHYRLVGLQPGRQVSFQGLGQCPDSPFLTSLFP